MIKVITYGTFDLLHHGHIRLLERAKSLGDYLIVGITSDSFDNIRGKHNVSQSLIERIENVKATGLADEIIVEEYEGQKIDDVLRLKIDVFTVGSDWVGKFDYLNQFCRVVYLQRTEGISSSKLRSSVNSQRFGYVGSPQLVSKYVNASIRVNGIIVSGIVIDPPEKKEQYDQLNYQSYTTYEEMLEKSNLDAIYIASHPTEHYEKAKVALERGINVLVESPLTLIKKESDELRNLAIKNNLILMESIKTAYSLAYRRLLLLIKSGIIGSIVSIKSTCTSLRSKNLSGWDSISSWGPIALLPIFQILGTNYNASTISSLPLNGVEIYTKIDFYYDNAVATAEVGNGVKSEGSLVISGTEGYIYVPSPWWKTDYFEVRYEDQNNNRRYYYKLEEEGILDLMVTFLGIIKGQYQQEHIHKDVSDRIVDVIGEVLSGRIDYRLNNNEA